MTGPLGRLLARAARPPVRFGDPAASTSSPAETVEQQVTVPEPDVARPRTHGRAAANAAGTTAPPAPLVLADDPPTAGVAGAPETEKSRAAEPRAAGPLIEPGETARPEPEPDQRAAAEPSPVPRGIRPGAAPAAEPATTAPQPVRTDAPATPSNQAHRERPLTPRPPFEDLLLPIAERAEASSDAHKPEQPPARVFVAPAERRPARLDALPATQRARAVAAPRSAAAAPAVPAHVPVAAAPAPSTAVEPAPTVVIDQIHVITPPAPAPGPDPLASLAAQRTGSSLHGGH